MADGVTVDRPASGPQLRIHKTAGVGLIEFNSRRSALSGELQLQQFGLGCSSGGGP
jgi:hypothetical protein